MYLDETLEAKHEELLAKMKDHVNSLIDEDGMPREGVTKEQLREAIEMVKKIKQFREQSEKGLKEISAMNKEHEKKVESTRDILRKSESRWGVSLPPLLKSMYRI